ncbi:hypothetical protein NM688_g992 [Phlebia brevispora]|uniref:Uncharacterized protein n=1 Tax=Phlebia brevispora TaxID=194682 RepID=A0ACC1TCL1_9APHY|nr:hypothetical protein NM688_g992 [Phlebia brevispora]
MFTSSWQSTECQTEHWPVHKPMCKRLNPGEVWGIEILSKGEAARLGIPTLPVPGRFRHILLPKGHPAFTMSELCPATKLCGISLRIFTTMLFTGRSVYRGDVEESGENQPAVYLRIEDDGFAPMHWQMNSPGTCIIYREDGKPLTKETIETIWAFHATVLIDALGYPEGDGWAPAPVRQLCNAASFQHFSRGYFREQQEKGRPGFDRLFVPL